MKFQWNSFENDCPKLMNNIPRSLRSTEFGQHQFRHKYLLVIRVDRNSFWKSMLRIFNVQTNVEALAIENDD